MIPEIIVLSLISIIILFIRTRNLDVPSSDFEIKGYKILIVAAVIEITANLLYRKSGNNNLHPVLSFHWILYFAVVTVTLLNLNKPYMRLLLIGTILNLIAIVSNDFKMPVYVSEILSNAEEKKFFLQSGQNMVHCLLTEDTKFKFLCDIITLPPPYPFPKTISIGDVFLLLGAFAFWQEI